MAVWRFFRSLWRLRQRKLDCELLWPSLVAGAQGDIRWAQNGMLTHAMSDAAWRDELTELEIYRVIARLTEHESAGNRSPWKGPAPSTGS
jgi:hypothetical protein